MSRRVAVVDNSNDGLRQAIEGLETKLDNYIQSLPDKFIPRPEHEIWRMSVEQRLSEVVAEQKVGKQWANDEHTKLSTQVVESERRIIQKLDERNNTSWGVKLMILTGAFGWIITLALYIISMIHPK